MGKPACGRICRLTAVIVMVWSVAAALSESLPVYHRPVTEGDAPYEESAAYMDHSPFGPEEQLLEVDILGIRQGDCIVLKCGGQTMLVDGGEGTRLPALEQYMQSGGMDGFDILFLTHAHDDHIEAQHRLVKRGHRAGKVISPYDAASRNKKWTEYRDTLEKFGIPYEKIDDGDVLRFGDATVHIMRDSASTNLNNYSAAAMVRFGDAAIFLAADIGGRTQRLLLERYGAEALKCDVYKVAHHGHTKAVAAFLQALDPALAVITNTRASTMDNDRQLDRYDIPRYYITTGTVRMQTNGKAWYVWQEPVAGEGND